MPQERTRSLLDLASRLGCTVERNEHGYLVFTSETFSEDIQFMVRPQHLFDDEGNRFIDNVG